MIPIWAFLPFGALIGALETPVLPPDLWKKELQASSETYLTAYRDEVPDTNRVLGTERFALDSNFKHGRDWRIKVHPLLQADPFNYSATERYWAEIPEAYVQLQDNGWRIQAGYNTFNWGVTDVYNPLDVLNARRLQDPLRQDKLGAPSLSVKKDVDNVSFEAVYIPLQRKSILPGEQSRWLPRQVFTTTAIGNGTDTAILNLPPHLQYHFDPDRERDSALSNNYAARVQVTGIAQGLDASFQYFEGAATSPAVDLTVSGTVVSLQPQLVIDADPRIALIPVYYRQREYGGSLVYAAGGMIFRFEGSATRLISRGSDLLGNAEEFVLAVERPFPIGGQDLTVILQGSYANRSMPLTNTATAFNRIFDRTALVALRYSFSEKMSVLVSALWDVRFHEEFAHLEGTYRLTDTWKLGLSFDGLWGDIQTPLGGFNNNDRAVMSLKADF
jgi:hypothetical protein